MKATRKMMVMFSAAGLALGVIAAPSVEITAVQQQYPWTNTVDITYEVRGVTNMEYFVRFTPTTSDDDPILNTEGEPSIQVALESNGVFTAQWYPQTNLQYTACKMTPAIFRGGSGGGNDYLIIDLEDWSYTYEPMATQEASNERYNTVEYKTKKMVFRRIAPGRYTIGHATEATPAASGHSASSFATNTVHVVEVPEGTCYYMGVFPLTVAQYSRVIGNSPNNDTTPRVEVSWNTMRGSALPAAQLRADANNTSSFLIRLSGLTGLRIDLPTEEMWEIAARAGETTRYYWGDSFNGDYAWWSGNKVSDGVRPQVGLKIPNKWGLYDMGGLVWEACLDVWNKGDLALKTTDIYTPSTTTAQGGNANARQKRGDRWIDAEIEHSVSLRGTGGIAVTANYARHGFRVAIVFK